MQSPCSAGIFVPTSRTAASQSVATPCLSQLPSLRHWHAAHVRAAACHCASAGRHAGKSSMLISARLLSSTPSAQGPPPKSSAADSPGLASLQGLLQIVKQSYKTSLGRLGTMDRLPKTWRPLLDCIHVACHWSLCVSACSKQGAQQFSSITMCCGSCDLQQRLARGCWACNGMPILCTALQHITRPVERLPATCLS